jgi:hypothetical protein
MAHITEAKTLPVDAHLEKVAQAVSVRSTDDLDGKPNDDFDQARQLREQWVDNTEEEKKLKRKLDWRILPCTWTLYLLGFLDRANVG